MGNLQEGIVGVYGIFAVNYNRNDQSRIQIRNRVKELFSYGMIPGEEEKNATTIDNRAFLFDLPKAYCEKERKDWTGNDISDMIYAVYRQILQLAQQDCAFIVVDWANIEGTIRRIEMNLTNDPVTDVDVFKSMSSVMEEFSSLLLDASDLCKNTGSRIIVLNPFINDEIAIAHNGSIYVPCISMYGQDFVKGADVVYTVRKHRYEYLDHTDVELIMNIHSVKSPYVGTPYAVRLDVKPEDQFEQNQEE